MLKNCRKTQHGHRVYQNCKYLNEKLTSGKTRRLETKKPGEFDSKLASTVVITMLYYTIGLSYLKLASTVVITMLYYTRRFVLPEEQRRRRQLTEEETSEALKPEPEGRIKDLEYPPEL